MEAVFGTLAALCSLAGVVPYVRDTLRGTTRPHRATWLIWSALSLVVFASQRADGASWSLALVAGHVAGCAVVLALSVRRGVGGGRPLDWALLALAGAGIAGWRVADEPALATAAVIVADLLAVVAMLPKTYRAPDSETLSTYVLGAVAGAFAVLAVGEWDAALLAYPLYITLGGAGLAALIAVRRRQSPPAARIASGSAPVP